MKMGDENGDLDKIEKQVDSDTGKGMGECD